MVIKVISHGYDVDVKNIVFLSNIEDMRVCKEHGLVVFIVLYSLVSVLHHTHL